MNGPGPNTPTWGATWDPIPAYKVFTQEELNITNAYMAAILYRGPNEATPTRPTGPQAYFALALCKVKSSETASITISTSSTAPIPCVPLKLDQLLQYEPIPMTKMTKPMVILNDSVRMHIYSYLYLPPIPIGGGWGPQAAVDRYKAKYAKHDHRRHWPHLMRAPTHDEAHEQEKKQALSWKQQQKEKGELATRLHQLYHPEEAQQWRQQQPLLGGTHTLQNPADIITKRMNRLAHSDLVKAFKADNPALGQILATHMNEYAKRTSATQDDESTSSLVIDLTMVQSIPKKENDLDHGSVSSFVLDLSTVRSLSTNKKRRCIQPISKRNRPKATPLQLARAAKKAKTYALLQLYQQESTQVIPRPVSIPLCFQRITIMEEEPLINPDAARIEDHTTENESTAWSSHQDYLHYLEMGPSSRLSRDHV
jgi:hypothetical protein